jgi:hypothetical protein
VGCQCVVIQRVEETLRGPYGVTVGQNPLVVLPLISRTTLRPFTKTGAELLFEFSSEPYERGSVTLTTNLPFGQWTEVFGSEDVGAAGTNQDRNNQETERIMPKSHCDETKCVLD